MIKPPAVSLSLQGPPGPPGPIGPEGIKVNNVFSTFFP